MTVRSTKFMLCTAAAITVLLPCAVSASEVYVPQVPARGLRVPLAGPEVASPVFIQQMPPGARPRTAPQPRRTHFTAAKLMVQDYSILALNSAAAILPLRRPSGSSLPSVGRGVDSQVNEPGGGTLPTVGRGLLNS